MRLFHFSKLAHLRYTELMATIFTQIKNGEISGYVIAQNEHAFAIVDKFPIRRGHILVIPKREVPDINDLETQEYVSLMLLAKELSHVLLKVTKAQRIGRLVEGFGVPDHAHLHLVPLFGPQELDMSLASEMSDEEMALFAQEFLSYWKNKESSSLGKQPLL